MSLDLTALLDDPPAWLYASGLSVEEAFERFVGFPAGSVTRIPYGKGVLLLGASEVQAGRPGVYAAHFAHSNFDTMWDEAADAEKPFRSITLAVLARRMETTGPAPNLLALVNALAAQEGTLIDPPHATTRSVVGPARSLLAHWTTMETQTGTPAETISLMLGLGLDDTARRVLNQVEALDPS